LIETTRTIRTNVERLMLSKKSRQQLIMKLIVKKNFQKESNYITRHGIENNY